MSEEKAKKSIWQRISRRQRKWFIVLSSLFLVYTLVGFLVVPPLLKWLVSDGVRSGLNRDCSIQSVYFNPFSLVLEIEDLLIVEPDGSKPFAGFALVHANLEIDSIFRWAVAIDELLIQGPFVRVVHNSDGSFNFSDLLEASGDAAPAEPAPPEEESGPLPLVLNDLSISDGDFWYEDKGTGSKHRVSEFALRIPFASTKDGDRSVFIKPFIRAKVNGRPLELEGQTKPFDKSLEAQFDLSLKQLELGPLWAYVPLDKKPQLASGTFSCDISLNFSQGADQRPRLNVSGALSLDRLELQNSGGLKLLGFESFKLAVSKFDLNRMKLACDSVELNQPFVNVALDEEGQLNWLRYAPTPADSPEPADASAEEADGAKAPDASAPEFQFEAGLAAIRQGRISFSDKSQGRDFKKEIKSLELELKDFSTTGKEASYDLSVGTDLTETITLKGDFRFAPLEELTGRFEAHNIQIPAYQAYLAGLLPFAVQSAQLNTSLDFTWKSTTEFTPQVTDFTLDLSQVKLNHPDLAGAVSSLESLKLSGGKADMHESKLSLASTELKGLALGIPDRGGKNRHQAYLGGLSVGTVAVQLKPLSLAMDRAALYGLKLSQAQRKSKALELKRLSVAAVKFQGPENKLGVGLVRLTGARIAAAVDARGRLNVGRILASPAFSGQKTAKAAQGLESDSPEQDNREEPKEKKGQEVAAAQGDEQAQPEQAPSVNSKFSFTLRKLLLEKSQIRFDDRSVQPPFAGKVDKIDGEVKNLSSRPGSRAMFNLSAQVLQDAKLEINGRISPTRLAQGPRFVMTMAGLELAKLSPYALKYLSYPIATGKMDLQLELSEIERELVGEQTVKMDKFELGEYRESEADLGIPITLALAILKDSSGLIELKIPMSGRLDDPEFELGALIAGAILNVITKIVTSPFTFIAGMFGGGEDINMILMAPGESELRPEAKTKLDTIVKALLGRPGLKVVVSAVNNEMLDRHGLAQKQLDLNLRTMKFKELQAQDQAPERPDMVTIARAEYPKYLERVWRASGLTQKKPPKEVASDPQKVLAWKRALIEDGLTIEQTEFVQLGYDRIQVVKTYLSGKEGISEERLFSKELSAKELSKNAKLKTGVLLGLQ